MALRWRHAFDALADFSLGHHGPKAAFVSRLASLTFAAFGIYNYGIREISKLRDDPDKLSRVYSSLFVIGIISNLLVGGIYVAYFLMRPHGVDTWIYAVMLIQLLGNIFYIEFVNL